MRKLITTLSFLFIAAICFGQKDSTAKDTTIQITVKLNDFKALLFLIDQNIDSKRTSKEILDFLQKNARIIEQPSDKPKEIVSKPKNK